MAQADIKAILKLRGGLRFRLIVFLLAAVAPLAAVSIYQSTREAATALQTARDNLQFAASLAAGRQAQIAETARQLLTAVAALSDQYDSRSGQCGDYFGRLRGQFPAYANFGIVDMDGHVRCHGLTSGTTFAGDRPYFRAAIASREFTVGEYAVGRLSRTPVLIFSQPVIGKDGALRGVAFAALKLDGMQASIADADLPPGARLAVLDRNGTVLATTNPRFPIGGAVASPVLREAIRAGRATHGETTDAQGEMRVFALAPVQGAAHGGLVVLVNQSRTIIVGASRKLLGVDLALLMLTVLAGGWLAWSLSGQTILRPALRILDGIRRVQTGETGVQVPVQPKVQLPEFVRMAEGFNQMSAALQEREQDLQKELARSQQSQATLSLVVNSMQDGLLALGTQGQLLLVNDAARAMLPMDDLAIEPAQWPQRLGLFLPGGTTVCDADELPVQRALRGESGDGMALLMRNEMSPAGRHLRCSYRPMMGPQGVVGALVMFRDVTDRIRIEEEHLLLSNAVGRLNDLVIITEAEPMHGDGPRIVFVNEAFERVTGYRLAEVIGRTPRILQGEGTDRAALDRIGRALDNRQPVREDLLNYTRDGRPIWLEVDIVPMSDDRGRYTHWIAVERDISGRVAAQLALQQSEQRYMALFQQAPLPMWMYDTGTLGFLAVNDAALAQYGYSREEFLGMTLRDIRPPQDVPLLESRVAELGNSPAQAHWIHQRKDGTRFTVDVISRPVTVEGRSARFVVAHDISDRLRAEHAVSEHLFSLQRAADAAHAIVQHQNVRDTVQEVADQARAVIRAHQAIVTFLHGTDWSQAIHLASLSEKYERWRKFDEHPVGAGVYALVCESNQPIRLTQQELEAHPRWRAFSGKEDAHPPMRGWLAVPLVDREGRNVGVLQLSDKYDGSDFTPQDQYVAQELALLATVAIENARLFEQVRDLNAGLERKVGERTAALVRQEALFRALAEEAPQVVWTWEPERHVTFLNRAWYAMVGGHPADWLGTRWIDAIHPDDRADSKRRWDLAVQSLTPYSGIRRLRALDGTYRSMAYRAVPVRDAQGTVAFWVGIDVDITDLKAVEEALLRSNRELEAFSYSVSHDLRAPLNTVDGFSRLLARELGQTIPPKAAHYLERIQAGAAQMGQLIEDLLSLAQVSRAPLRHEPVDLSAIAHAILEQLRTGAPHRRLQADIQPGLVVHGDPRLIRVVMDNLLGNAWKFSARCEVTRIAVGKEGTDAMTGDDVLFVRDNGVGFDMAYAGKLFETFQRLHTDAEFPGTGVGLATVSRVISRHGGRIWANASPGVGATLYFVLPRRPVVPVERVARHETGRAG